MEIESPFRRSSLAVINRRKLKSHPGEKWFAKAVMKDQVKQRGKLRLGLSVITWTMRERTNCAFPRLRKKLLKIQETDHAVEQKYKTDKTWKVGARVVGIR